MSREEIIKNVSEDTGLLKRQIDKALDSILYHITRGLQRDGRVQFNNYFVIYLHHSAPRMGRNFQADEPAQIPSKRVPRLRAAKSYLKIFNDNINDNN